MIKLIIDSSAWIEYLMGGQNANTVNKYFENNELFTTGVCVAEVVAKALKEGFSSRIPIEAIYSLSQIISVDLEIGKEGGRIYAELRKTKSKISLSDTISIAAARKLSAKIITFDTDFDKVPEAIILKKLI